jgi:hypothetical protein
MALQHPAAQEGCKFITQTALRQCDLLWITLFPHRCGFQANSRHALAKPPIVRGWVFSREYTDAERNFVSEASVYRLLKALDFCGSILAISTT